MIGLSMGPYVVTMGLEKPQIDTTIIFPREYDAPEYHGYFVLNTSFRVQPMDPRRYG